MQTCTPDGGGTAADSGTVPVPDAGVGSVDSGGGTAQDALPSPGQEGGAHGAESELLEGGCNLGKRAPAMPMILLTLALLALLPQRRRRS
jgi:hypothetical protein